MMIDIHSHVLPGLDDGSKDMETSVAMCKMAADDGIEAIVCSAHANDRYRFDPAVVLQKIEEVNARTGGVPRLYPGCDFHLSYENIQAALSDRARFTISHGRYLLVEFADLSIPPNMKEVFFDFQSRGIIPIITHPERNASLMDRRNELMQWVRGGALVQITAASLTGRFGKESTRFCHWLIERTLVHFVATDSHNLTSRPPVLSKAYKAVAGTYGADAAEMIFREYPRAAVENQQFVAPAPTEPRSRGFFARIASALRS